MGVLESGWERGKTEVLHDRSKQPTLPAQAAKTLQHECQAVQAGKTGKTGTPGSVAAGRCCHAVSPR
jgi:hypothetical protein